MTLLLALDTATSAVAVALHDGSHVLASTSLLEPRRHAEVLMPSIDSVVSSAGVARRDLTAIAVGVGPGPFTGLRAGIVTAATLGEVLGIPTYGVCSLDAIAHRVWTGGDGPSQFVVATDARRKEVYWARYSSMSSESPESAGSSESAASSESPRSSARLEREGLPQVTRPAGLPDGIRELPTAGRGTVLYPDQFPCALDVLDVDAGDLAAVALEREDLRLPLQPLYLRQPDAMPAHAPKSVLS